MSDEPALLTHAREQIRAGEYRAAVDALMSGLAELPLEFHKKAYTYAGLAFYFNREWAEALGPFMFVAQDSDVPEDWYNVAMAQVMIGYPAGALESWQRVVDLTHTHKDAPETNTFFQKKLLFAQALRDTGACNDVGLDLLERQLMGFYTNYHTTDAHTWGIRGVPQFEDVMTTLRDHYRLMGRSLEEWAAVCDRTGAAIDDDGRALCTAMRGSLT